MGICRQVLVCPVLDEPRGTVAPHARAAAPQLTSPLVKRHLTAIRSVVIALWRSRHPGTPAAVTSPTLSKGLCRQI